MLIVSKFHDYYDSVRAYGVDKSCVYKRENQKKGYKLGDWRSYVIPSTEYLSGYTAHFSLVGFCGRIYPLVRMDRSVSYNCDYCDNHIDSVFFYNAEELISFFKDRNITLQRFRGWRYFSRSEKSLQEFFKIEQYDKLLPIFVDNGVPIFHLKHANKNEELELNPKLKSLKFQKVKDTATAFQEIFMFMSGVLGSRGPEPLPISNKLKAQAHGHDGKYSFKRAPGEQKRRKKSGK